MNIPVKYWQKNSNYIKDDIVRVGNLARPEGINESDFDLREGPAGIIYDIFDTDIFDEKVIDASSEKHFGFLFPASHIYGYKVKCFVRKNTGDTSLNDSFKTYLENRFNDDGSQGFDVDNSIGVGIGLKFYDENLDQLKPNDPRNVMQVVSEQRVSFEEYYKLQLDILPEDVPKQTRYASVFVFVYGISAGSFKFKDVFASNMSEFFYCKIPHKSSFESAPNKKLDYWTQKFDWRPSYGSTIKFDAVNEVLKLGEGNNYLNSSSINSLPLKLSLQFSNRTDQESKAIVHFLKEKHFSYDSMFGLDYKGNRLHSSESSFFEFDFSYPYKNGLFYRCESFDHQIIYRNNNNISADFVCDKSSILDSLEGHKGYDPNFDAVIPVFINEDIECKRGEAIRFKTFSNQSITEDGHRYQKQNAQNFDDLVEISEYKKDANGIIQSGLLLFRNPKDIKVGEFLNIDVLEPKNSIFSVGVVEIKAKIRDELFVFEVPGINDLLEDPNFLRFFNTEWGGIEKKKWSTTENFWNFLKEERNPDSVGNYKSLATDSNRDLKTDQGAVFKVLDDSISAPVIIKRLRRNPDECLNSKPIFPEGVSEVQPFFENEERVKSKRILFTKDYKRFELSSIVSANINYVMLTPLEDFKLKKEDDLRLIAPMVKGRSSIYLKDIHRVSKYPWLKIRTFEHNPSLSINIRHDPKFLTSPTSEFYEKIYKHQINQDLNILDLTFDQRYDDEALEILQFLESHLGYKKFRFYPPRPYLSSRFDSSSDKFTFFCPNWSHTINYKNNHTISAQFVESRDLSIDQIKSIKVSCDKKQDETIFSATIDKHTVEHYICNQEDLALKEKSVKLTNTCKNKIKINKILNDNPSLFTIISDNYIGQNIKVYNSSNTVELPVEIEPGNSYYINTYFHPTQAQIDNGTFGTFSDNAGEKFFANIEIIPGFMIQGTDGCSTECEASFVIKGEFSC